MVVAREFQFVHIFNFPQVKGVPYSVEDKTFLFAFTILGKLMMSG